MLRKTFVSHFVLMLAIGAGVFFAWMKGVPQHVYASDLSHMTTVIAALFLVTTVWLGWQAWWVDDIALVLQQSVLPRRADAYQALGPGDASFGHLAERLSVMCGLAGTTIGLSLQGNALMGGGASFGALSTSLFTTAGGIVSAALISIMVHNLENGIKRAKQ